MSIQQTTQYLSGPSCMCERWITLSIGYQGRIQDFFRRGALVSCSTSTPINHIVFFFCSIPVVLENRRSSQEGGGVCTPCTLPLDLPLDTYLYSVDNAVGFMVDSATQHLNNQRLLDSDLSST